MQRGKGVKGHLCIWMPKRFSVQTVCRMLLVQQCLEGLTQSLRILVRCDEVLTGELFQILHHCWCPAISVPVQQEPFVDPDGLDVHGIVQLSTPEVWFQHSRGDNCLFEGCDNSINSKHKPWQPKYLKEMLGCFFHPSIDRQSDKLAFECEQPVSHPVDSHPGKAVRNSSTVATCSDDYPTAEKV